MVDARTVIATHLSHLIQTHAAELLGRGEVQQLLDQLTKTAPKLIEDVVPKLVPLATLQKVLQNLLEEGVHIRDMRTILESWPSIAAHRQDPAELTRRVRVALAPCDRAADLRADQELEVIALDPELERMLTRP